MKMICENCIFWDTAGPKGSTETRIKNGKQLFMHYCVRYPQTVWKWHDDWCGEFKSPSNGV